MMIMAAAASMARAATPLKFEPIAVVHFTQVCCLMEPRATAHVWGRAPMERY